MVIPFPFLTTTHQFHIATVDISEIIHYYATNSHIAFIF